MILVEWIAQLTTQQSGNPNTRVRIPLKSTCLDDFSKTGEFTKNSLFILPWEWFLNRILFHLFVILLVSIFCVCLREKSPFLIETCFYITFRLSSFDTPRRSFQMNPGSANFGVWEKTHQMGKQIFFSINN